MSYWTDHYEPPAHLAWAIERARAIDFEATRRPDYEHQLARRSAWADVDALVRQGWARWCPYCLDEDGTSTGHVPGDRDERCPCCLGWMLCAPPARPEPCQEFIRRVGRAWEDSEELAHYRATEDVAVATGAGR